MPKKYVSTLQLEFQKAVDALKNAGPHSLIGLKSKDINRLLGESSRKTSTKKALYSHGLKICSKCSIVKIISDFWASERYSDGLNVQCISCKKAYYIENREDRISYSKNYQRKNKEKTREIQDRWLSKNRNKQKIYRIVRDAIRKGILSKLCCEVCGNLKTHAHHDDYGRPLSVRWLCPYHHKLHHIKSGTEEGA